MKPLQVIKLLQALQKAKQRIPKELGNVTFYGSEDRWLYMESQHPNMCGTCHSYHMQSFTGVELRAAFPYHIITDENFIYPKVHPNCWCCLVRLFPVEALDASQVETSVSVLPSGLPSELQTPVVEKVLGEPRQVQVSFVFNLDGGLPYNVEVLAPLQNTSLSGFGVEKLMLIEREDDFTAALNSMVWVGYITLELQCELEEKRKKQKQKLEEKQNVES